MLKGRRRSETDRFVALRSHYLFVSQFTTPGIEGAHEKGGVEGEVGRFRRNHLVPVPAVGSLAELNVTGLAADGPPHWRIGDEQGMTVGQAWALERPLLRALPGEPYDASRAGAQDPRQVGARASPAIALHEVVGCAAAKSPRRPPRRLFDSRAGSGRDCRFATV